MYSILQIRFQLARTLKHNKNLLKHVIDHLQVIKTENILTQRVRRELKIREIAAHAIYCCFTNLDTEFSCELKNNYL